MSKPPSVPQSRAGRASRADLASRLLFQPGGRGKATGDGSAGRHRVGVSSSAVPQPRLLGSKLKEPGLRLLSRRGHAQRRELMKEIAKKQSQEEELVAAEQRLSDEIEATLPHDSPQYFLDQARADGDMDRFCYLVSRNRDPYDLKIVPYSAIGEDYFTLSLRGVNHFFQGGSEHTPLDRWLYEANKFRELRKLPFFRDFFIRKTFHAWRKSIRAQKFRSASYRLSKQSFLVNETLLSCLMTVRQISEDIRGVRLHRISAYTTYTLSQFISTHKDALEDTSERLSVLFDQVRVSVLNACRESLRTLAFENRERQRVVTDTQQQQPQPADPARSEAATNPVGARSIRSSETGRPSRRTTATATTLFDHEKRHFTYQELAAQKSACKRLIRFLRLVDYIIFDAFREVIIESTAEILEFLQKTPERYLSRTLAGDLEPGVPLFQIYVSLDGNVRVYPTQKKFIDNIGRVLEDYRSISALYKRLLNQDGFVPILEKAGASRVFDPTEVILESVVRDNQRYRTTVGSIKQEMKSLFAQVGIYTNTFMPFKAMFNENATFNIHESTSLQFYRDHIERFNQQIEAITSIPDVRVIGRIEVHLTPLKDTLMPSSTDNLNSILDFLPQIAKKHATALTDKLKNYSKKLGTSPTTVQDFIVWKRFYHQVLEEQPEVDSEDNYIRHLYEIMEDCGCEIADLERAIYKNLTTEVDNFQKALDRTENSIEEKLPRFIKQYDDEVKGFRKHILQVQTGSTDQRIADVDADVDIVVALCEDLLEQVRSLRDQSHLYKDYERVLNVPDDKDFSDVDILYEDVATKHTLWASLRDFREFRDASFEKQFGGLDLENLDSQLVQFSRTASRCTKHLIQNPVTTVFAKEVEAVKVIVPLVRHLRNPAIVERHIFALEKELDLKLPSISEMTILWLLDHDLPSKSKIIQTIAVRATNEKMLEDMLSNIQSQWSDIDLDMTAHKNKKDLFILRSVEDILTVIEDHLQILSTIRGSKYVGAVESKLQEWTQRINYMSSTLEHWLDVQKNWLYLESIFSVPDIARQLPDETPLFQAVDKQFREILMTAASYPNALSNLTRTGLLESFKKMGDRLEIVQKGLEAYLNRKRRAFPRFYFLQNDELLEILSASKTPQLIFPHLKKIFDNVHDLEYVEENNEINAVLSAEGERIEIGRLKPRPPVELWLNQLQDALSMTLDKILTQGISAYEGMERIKYILQYPAQLVIATSQIFWVREVTEILLGASGSSMFEYHATLQQRLNSLADLIRTGLSPLQRKKLTALITLDVHNADIVEELAQLQVSSVDDFEWLKRLRYYWEEDRCVIRMVNTEFTYGYEYLGCTGRLVITPLTDCCYITCLGALHQHLGGSPAGPAGTGKTETVKDLGKALATMVVVYNCSEQVTIDMTERLFSGLAQTGSWACLDEFNRIQLEVLSVIAQQVHSIQQAIHKNLTEFDFGTYGVIPLKPRCGIFITMNPGYAGRTELPDNLKALFRPISMQVPDYALIAEISLYAEGFKNARVLSKKMVHLYKLASEQLSQQHHYDFGMRAIKSILVMAGMIKRKMPDMPEDVLLIKAMKDSNIPKFLADDIPLFNGIVRDLFPGVEVDEEPNELLISTLQIVVEEQGLEWSDSQITKIIQFFDTLNIRHGVMLVGPTGGGKSTVLNTLQQTINRIHSDGRGLYHVLSKTLNPKSITMGQLYGQINELTQDWINGIVTLIVKNAAEDQSKKRHWTVFDGPVDALWIENMNTVLDDNKMLCLPNGQRIKLTDRMSMIFEVGDLAVASPATVSRCGMVYVDGDNVGWRLMLLSLMRKHLSGFPEITIEHLMTLFEQHVDSILTFVDKQCDCYIATSKKGMIRTVFDLIYAVLTTDLDKVELTGVSEILEQELVGITDSELIRMHKIKDIAKLMASKDERAYCDLLSKCFSFGLIWGIGGTLTEASRELFDAHIKNEHSVLSPSISGFVYDYFIDFTDNSFISWDDIVTEYKHDPKKPFFDILVPTKDTVRFSYLLRKLQSIERPVLFTGVSGVGKSVIIQDQLREAVEAKIFTIEQNFSAQTTAGNLQDLLEAKLDDKRAKLYPPAGFRSSLLFVDDVNLPKKDYYGSQPPIELLRQVIGFEGLYNRSKGHWTTIPRVSLLAAGAPPGGGRQEMTERFTSLLDIFAIPEPDKRSMLTIFSSILTGYLRHIEYEHGPVLTMVPASVEASIEVYRSACEHLLPTPQKSHYTFNMRDLSKVIQGLMMMSPLEVKDGASLCNIWVHENLRQFADRLINDEDRAWFDSLLVQLAKKHFQVFNDDLLEEKPVYSDFFGFRESEDDSLPYRSVSDQDKLVTKLEDLQDDFNLSQSQLESNLVFFDYCVRHLCRLTRILGFPRGNALLVGVGGSGKQSITRLAAHIRGYECFELELKRNYDSEKFHEDLRALYRLAGVENKSVVFLMNEAQITEESFFEDLNNILNSGEIPNLFTGEEYENLLSDMQPICRQLGVSELENEIYRFFIQRVRDNLHVVVCLSPIGHKFRERLRQFPSLINCCTMDWYDSWPVDGLYSVSKQYVLDRLEFHNEHLMENVDALKLKVSKVFVKMYLSAVDHADQFFSAQKRRFYVTPTLFLKSIEMFLELYRVQSNEIDEKRQRLEDGLNKLKETNEKIAEMRVELEALEPELQELAQEADRLIFSLAQEQRKVDSIKSVVEREKIEVEEATRVANAIKKEAEDDLNLVLPELAKAQESLSCLEPSHIHEIRAFNRPPDLVKLVIQAVSVILAGSAVDWDTAKRTILRDSQFLPKLISYDMESVSDSVLRKLRPFINNESFTEETVREQSVAAATLCAWVCAVDKVTKQLKIVKPKQLHFQEAEANLHAKQMEFQQKMDQLAGYEAQLAELRGQYESQLAKKEKLSNDIQSTQRQMERATQLTVLLADESVRWAETVKSLENELAGLVGTMLIAAGFLLFAGPFSDMYRVALVKDLIKHVKEMGFDVDDNVKLADLLSSQLEIRGWNVFGLPSDNVSIENAIIMKWAQRFTLMIDPQNQASTFIRQLESQNSFKVLKMSDSSCLKQLEQSIYIGQSVLIEDVGAEVDPVLYPILDKNIINDNGRLLIKIGDSFVNFDPSFRLYMTTTLPNPHYLPEIFIKVSVINFTVTKTGLSEQLLGHVVQHEKPDLETQRSELVININKDKKDLSSLEDEILNLVYSTENVLADDNLIVALQKSKEMSAVIADRLEKAEVTERQIEQARLQYVAIANRGSLLYFIVRDMASVDNMYQFSLEYFVSLFTGTMKNTAESEDVETRISTLIDAITHVTYVNVCRGLFEKHKTLFSFLIGAFIDQDDGVISPAMWNYFIRGRVGAVEDVSSPVSFLSDNAWKEIHYLETTFDCFDGLSEDIIRTPAKWMNFIHDKNGVPEPWQSQNSGFEHLILFKVMLESDVINQVPQYIMNALGERFIKPPSFDLAKVFGDSTSSVPIIFILSPGGDPTASFTKFAQGVGMGSKFQIRSLGQGQGPIAEAVIAQAAELGHWVMLQNCHLCESWMPDLERRCKGLREDGDRIHPDFRLWLSSMPCDFFPSSVLQNSIKVTIEPPKGLRNNLVRVWQDISDEDFSLVIRSHERTTNYRKLLFSLTFFHSIIQERRKFGPLGWNVHYEFNESDIYISISQLRMFLSEHIEVPWPALKFLFGVINYGGRVTDAWDKRLISSILDHFFTENCLLTKDYKFTSLPEYYIPDAALQSVDLIKNYIDTLPLSDLPEVFGMHQNASMAFQRMEMSRLINSVIAIQPKADGGEGGVSSDDVVSTTVQRILDECPELLSRIGAIEELFVTNEEGLLQSMTVHLLQEIDRFNNLLSVIRETSEDLLKALKGLVVMSDELESMYISILNNQVPSLWSRVAYPSLKPLSSWWSDLQARVAMLAQWLAKGQPIVYWLSGFFFTQGFLTAVLQSHARKYHLPIDSLSFKYEVLPPGFQPEEAPSDGAYVRGLFLDDARWDTEQGLVEPRSAELYSELPIVHFLPVQNYQPQGLYACPLYRTSERRGVLSTTGHSTNFVVAVHLPSEESSESWILRGAALLCQLDD